jgi:hypothetical protein
MLTVCPMTAVFIAPCLANAGREDVFIMRCLADCMSVRSQGWLLGWSSPRRALRLSPRPAPGPASHSDSPVEGDVLAAGDSLGSHLTEGAARSPSAEVAEDGVVVWERACGGVAGLLQVLNLSHILQQSGLLSLSSSYAPPGSAQRCGGPRRQAPRRAPRPPCSHLRRHCRRRYRGCEATPGPAAANLGAEPAAAAAAATPFISLAPALTAGTVLLCECFCQ